MFVPRLRLIVATSALGAAMALGAQAAIANPPATDENVQVCNQATPHSLGGNLDATDAPTGSPAERYRDDLHAMPGNGNGLVRAAANSPALSICADGDGDPVPGGT